MSRPVDLDDEMRQALAHPHSRNWVGVARVRPDGESLYCPDPGGPVLAAIVGVIPDDELIDLLAIDLHQPRRWRRRLGVADLLGERNLLGLSFTKESVQVHRGPAEWLNAGGDGVCILEWTPSVVGLLSAIEGGLVPADTSHGQELRRNLLEAGKIKLPPILVADPARAAA